MNVIQAQNLALRIMRCDGEWSVIGPMFPSKPRGVQRVDDRLRKSTLVLARFPTNHPQPAFAIPRSR
jgi:hypothetical protein